MKGTDLFAKNNRNKSMVLLIVVTFWVSYVLITLTQYYINISGLVDEIVHDKQVQMMYIQDNQVPQLLGDNVDLAAQNLLKAKELHLVDFYVLQRGSQVVSIFDNKGKIKGLDADYKVFNQVLATENVAFRTIKILDYRLTVGIFQNRSKIILKTLSDLKGPILRDIAMVTFFLSLIVYFFLKDIIDLSRILASRDRKEMGAVKAFSKEGALLLQAAQSYETTQKTLEHDNRIYTETLTPAIIHELKSGTKPPCVFSSTMIRVDLNGYTQIFLEKKDEYITEIMNKYFTLAREIIERYHGLIYQYVGDEIVFHIKEDQGESQALALAALRSIFELAQELEDGLPEDADHYFKVKGSFVLGKIRFVNQDSGFSLSGLPLIESARLLSQVDDKSASSVTFYAEAAPFVEKLCKIDQSKETLLKGFSKPSVLCRAKVFTSVGEVIAQGSLGQLRYFRSDRDLIQVHSFLKKKLKAGESEEFFEVYNILKSFQVQRTSAEQAAAYVELLQISLQLNSQGIVNDRVLASVISLANHLVPADCAQGDLIEALEKSLVHKDSRVSANSIIVLGEFVSDIAFLRRFMHSKNNRISADAILVAGKRNFDSEIAKKLEEFLESQNPLFRASGAWVLRQLLDHYRTTDLVFYNANTDLQRLAEKLPKAG